MKPFPRRSSTSKDVKFSETPRTKVPLYATGDCNLSPSEGLSRDHTASARPPRYGSSTQGMKRLELEAVQNPCGFPKRGGFSLVLRLRGYVSSLHGGPYREIGGTACLRSSTFDFSHGRNLSETDARGGVMGAWGSKPGGWNSTPRSPLI